MRQRPEDPVWYPPYISKNFVNIWCADCAYTYYAHRPTSLWAWLDAHKNAQTIHEYRSERARA